MATLSNPSTRLLRNVALPVEHGGWAFLIKPLLLGLLLAPSIAGAVLSIFGLAGFLLYQPAQIALKDHLKGKRYSRTAWAERFVLLYGSVVIGGLLVAIVTARSPFGLALLIGLPFAGLQLLLVTRGYARAAITEICGAMALSVLTPAILLANGASILYALAFWLVPVVRAATSILYIRARLRRSRGETVNRAIPLLTQVAGIFVLCGAWIMGLLPISAPIAILILASRAVYGLYKPDASIPAKQIGFQEIGFGLLTVILVVAVR